MDKQATDDSLYADLGPVLGKLNKLRFQNAILAGVLGGGGIATAAGLLRNIKDRSVSKKEDTDDDTIVLTLPVKGAESAYDSMRNAKPGESRPTANGGTQLRVNGKFSGKVPCDRSESMAAKKAEGDPGNTSVVTIVANALGMTAGGVLAYDMVGRLFDRMQERRLKRKLDAAQHAYVSALEGESKRAELVNSVTAMSERRYGAQLEKDAAGIRDAFDWVVNLFPDAATKPLKYTLGAYVAALLAGTGATAYVTKKVMDREFPEEKPRKDINRPTRIVLRTTGGTPKLAEYHGDELKEASGETCSALTAMLPIYMDAVEGRPSRTLAGPYVKLAEAMGTDPAGLVKAAADNMWPVYMQILRNPRVLWDILVHTRFGFDASQRNVLNILRRRYPDVLRGVVGAARQHAPDAYYRYIDDYLAPKASDGTAKSIGRAVLRHSPRFIQDKAVDWATGISKPPELPKAIKSMVPGGAPGMVVTASDDSILGSNCLASILRPEKDDDTDLDTPNPKATLTKAKALLRNKRKITVTGVDRGAREYLAKNSNKLKKVLARLNARGTI